MTGWKEKTVPFLSALDYVTFTHLADAFIQSLLQVMQVRVQFLVKDRGRRIEAADRTTNPAISGRATLPTEQQQSLLNCSTVFREKDNERLFMTTLTWARATSPSEPVERDFQR